MSDVPLYREPDFPDIRARDVIFRYTLKKRIQFRFHVASEWAVDL